MLADWSEALVLCSTESPDGSFLLLVSFFIQYLMTLLLCTAIERNKLLQYSALYTVMTLIILLTHACLNNVDPDQTPQKAASDLVLHCLPVVYDTSTGSKNGLIQLLGYA